MENIMAAKDCIKNIRHKLCLSPHEFAEWLGIQASSVYYYEMGKRKPTAKTIRHIVDKARKKGIKVNYEDFFSEE